MAVLEEKKENAEGEKESDMKEDSQVKCNISTFSVPINWVLPDPIVHNLYAFINYLNTIVSSGADLNL